MHTVRTCCTLSAAAWSLRQLELGPDIIYHDWSCHPHLNALSLSSAGLTAIPQQLADLSGLARLDLSFNAIGDMEVTTLSTLQQLTW